MKINIDTITKDALIESLKEKNKSVVRLAIAGFG